MFGGGRAAGTLVWCGPGGGGGCRRRGLNGGLQVEVVGPEDVLEIHGVALREGALQPHHLVLQLVRLLLILC